MRSLTLKLMLAFMLVGLIGAVVAAAFSQVATRTEFNRARLLDAQDRFANRVLEYYEVFGSFEGVNDWLLANPPDDRPPLGVFQPQPAPGSRPPPLFLLLDLDYRAMTRAPEVRTGQIYPERERLNIRPVMFEGKKVGYIKYLGGEAGLTDREAQLLSRIYQGLALAGVVATLVALVVGAVLARNLTRPARALTHAIHAMRDGQLQQDVKVQSRDELGELTRAFNQMSAQIAHEQHLRKQMTADIAHELRTPLTVISGYLEAMSNGTLPVTPTRLQTVFTQATHLQHLVEDLRTLSLADAGELRLNRQAITPEALLRHTAQFYEAQAAQGQVRLTVTVAPDLPTLYGDRDRLLQVLGNLVSNALRHTPPAGTIALSAALANKHVQLTVQDSGEGIPPDVLPHIFDRFYRGDSARNTAYNTASTGLGLAIVKSLVQAHNGDIIATSVLGQGTTFCIHLPI
ncbi:MAG: HAMP domain-containing histidine kinase [Anaerolineae bacterium]|nr:HAMP domain-containing histidine kinase [Anaerolineae bacterium]